jgi:hypothetical protein
MGAAFSTIKADRSLPTTPSDHALEALSGAGLDSGRGAWHSDEMRLGFRGQTRRVLAPKGAKVVQRVQPRYEWSYLILAISPLTGEVRWEWIERMRKESRDPTRA